MFGFGKWTDEFTYSDYGTEDLTLNSLLIADIKLLYQIKQVKSLN